MYDIAAAAAAVSAVTWELSIKNSSLQTVLVSTSIPVGGGSRCYSRTLLCLLLSLLGKLQKFNTYSRHKKSRHMSGVSKRGSFEEIC